MSFLSETFIYLIIYQYSIYRNNKKVIQKKEIKKGHGRLSGDCPKTTRKEDRDLQYDELGDVVP